MIALSEYLRATLEREGSTRVVGLLRIAFVLLVWCRWADEVLPFRELTPQWVTLSVSFFVCTAWMLVGWHGRLATAATALVVSSIVFYFGRVRGNEDWVHHHTTLLAYFGIFLSLTPNSTSFSIDRWLAVREAERAGKPPPEERGPLWGSTLLALQVSSIYFWSAYDKTSYGFLAGYRLEQIFVEVWWGSDLWTGPGIRAIFCAMAVSVVVVEYVLAVGLWFKRTHWLLFPMGLLMHAVFYVALPVSTFTLTMCALYLAFLDPDDVHRVIDRLLGHPQPVTGGFQTPQTPQDRAT